MPLDASLVGWKSDSYQVTWDSARAILYALGVGAGTVDGLDELAFVTENTAGVAQQVLPTFPVVLGQGLFSIPYGDVDRSKLVHAEQSIELLGEITPDGSGRYQARVTGVYDKGSGALVRTEGLLTGADGTPLARLAGGSFIRAVIRVASGPSAPGSALRSRRAPHCEPPSGSKGTTCCS
jgi:hypothetical protein